MEHNTKIKPMPDTVPLPALLPQPIPIVLAQYHNIPGLIPNSNNYSNDSYNHHSFHTFKGAPIANVLCFREIADKITGFVYNKCTGKFQFMSLDGNVCFFIMYHYKTNTILATLIPGLDSKSILAAYSKNFEYLVSKGYTPKLNIMDNQATKTIKAYLMPQQCKLQLVEPNNHRVNAAEHAIQTFKNHFI